MSQNALSRLGQQLLNDHFRLFVIALAELMMPDPPPRVGEVESRPVLVIEGLPDSMLAIDRDGIIDSHIFHGPTNVVDVLLKLKLGRVHADYHQSLRLILLGPRADIVKCSAPVNARVGPEVDENNFPAQARRCKRLGVEPAGGAAERREFT